MQDSHNLFAGQQEADSLNGRKSINSVFQSLIKINKNKADEATVKDRVTPLENPGSSSVTSSQIGRCNGDQFGCLNP